MNRLIIIGNLTRDPESKTTSNGKTVCNFTLAVNRRDKDESGNYKADFFRIAAWGQLGENCQKYLSKGKKVGVIGTVSVHAYSDKDGNPAGSLEVFAQEVEYLSPAGQTGAEQTAPAPAPTAVDLDSSELPF